MDIIINTVSNDQSTDDILDWLYYFCENPVRLNDEYKCELTTVKIDNEGADFILVSGEKQITLSTIRSFWYRRGKITLIPEYKIENLLLQSSYNYYKREMNALTDVIYKIGDSHYTSLNKYHDNDTNKLTNLIEAQKLGMKIPPTIITNNIFDLEQFISKYSEIIMKPIAYPEFKAFNRKLDIGAQIAVGTVKTTRKEIINLLKSESISRFLPTLFQSYIEKKYEIRSFFINDTFYSMAIFSQANEKTKNDFRNYDYERPNRTIPYKLPVDMEDKLRKLMKKIDMNCGSFDIIVTPAMEYLFLEVNPIGQFQWLSKNCNYYIEKHIAKTLCL